MYFININLIFHFKKFYFQWVENLKRNVLQFDGNPVPIVLFVNKCDLPSQSLNTERLNTICSNYNLDAWYLTSAKRDINIGMLIIKCFNYCNAFQFLFENKVTRNNNII